MNPSTTGWVKKFGHIMEKQELLATSDMALFYDLKSWGFWYGGSIQIPKAIVPEHQSSLDEKNKINLLYALYAIYTHHKTQSFDHFLESLFHFYEQLNDSKKTSSTGPPLPSKLYEWMEKKIDQRVFIPASIFEKTMGQHKINPFVFLDVLSYRRFLNHKEASKNDVLKLENIALKVSQLSLLSLPNANHQNFDLTKGYSDPQDILKNLDPPLDQTEKVYFLIFSCLSSKVALNQEICNWLDLDKTLAKQEIETLLSFMQHHKKEVPAFRSSHLGEQIYDNLVMLVNKLILRNSKRLLKELKGSQELVVLLSKSTHKELNDIEKKKIQEQSLDLIKAIPSLAIFLLPGGAVLLPIFIKLIPKLLPAAFDDNRI